MNTRRAVEAALPAAIFSRILRRINADLQAKDEHTDLERMFTGISVAAISSADDVGNASDRVRKALDKALSEYEGRTIAFAVLVSYYWLANLLDTGYLVLGDESDFDRAFAEFRDRIFEDVENESLLDDLQKSARKQAPKMHARLQEMGLYQ